VLRILERQLLEELELGHIHHRHRCKFKVPRQVKQRLCLCLCLCLWWAGCLLLRCMDNTRAEGLFILVLAMEAGFRTKCSTSIWHGRSPHARRSCSGRWRSENEKSWRWLWL